MASRGDKRELRARYDDEDEDLDETVVPREDVDMRADRAPPPPPPPPSLPPQQPPPQPPGPPPLPPGMAEDAGATVLDRGGELSMSVEETNRVRIALGMKPLKLEPREGEARQQNEDHLAKLAAAQRARDGAELATRVAQAKERRALESRFAVKGLGEADAGEDDGDTAGWVARSRALDAVKRSTAAALAAKTARALAEQDGGCEGDDSGAVYTSRSLAGLRVLHATSDLRVGEAQVLVLRDQGVLEEGDDELENVRMASERDVKRAREAARPTPSFRAAVAGQVPGLLSKYDQPDAMKTIILGADIDGGDDEGGPYGGGDWRPPQPSDAGGDALRASDPWSRDGEAAPPRPAAEYYTADEARALFKPAPGAKPKKLRRKEKAPPASEGGGEGATLAAMLESGMGKTTAPAGDHGSRSARVAHPTIAGALLRDAAYDNAAAKAIEASRRLAAAAGVGPSATKVLVSPAVVGSLPPAAAAALAKAAAEAAPPPNVGDDEAEEEEADRQLTEALARSRRQAMAAAQMAQHPGVGKVASMAECLADARVDGDTMPPESGAAVGRMVFTAVEEFCRSIDTTATTAVKLEDGDDVGAEGGAVDALLATVLAGGALQMDMDGGAPGANEEDDGPTVEPTMVNPVAAETRIGMGLAGALQALREKGALGDTIGKAGRTNDIKAEKWMLDSYAKGTPFHQRERGPAPDAERSFDVKLDRFDEFGRLQTPKEQFRTFCHRFHGIEPSKNKKDKRYKQFMEEKRKMAMREGDTPLGAMERVNTLTEAAHTPFVVLSGSVKPGQLSDAATGMATMERDESRMGWAASATAGSARAVPAASSGGLSTGAVSALPVMSGARKVEFMLGGTAAKRKLGGGMPPPAAKAPKRS